MTAALLAPPVSSRRVSAGIRPDPGATSRLPSWWGATDWLEVEVPAALDERPEVLTDHHVSREAVLAVARGMAAHADYRTGRDCRPTNERLVELLRCSLSTVQRARRALKALGLVVELVRGRSIMTRAERLVAWRRGSTHRKVAAEFALFSRPRRTENEDRRSAPRTDRGGPTAGSRRLAEAVRDRLGWLHGQSWRRLAPLLGRFARAGWTVADVELAVRDVLGVRGHRVPRDVRFPAAYLAKLLRDVDHEGVRPSVEAAEHEAWLREQAAAQRAARRAWVVAMRTSCAHGVPAGDTPHPETGALGCRDCRQETTP